VPLVWGEHAATPMAETSANNIKNGFVRGISKIPYVSIRQIQP
jgi:hypothetical protein